MFGEEPSKMERNMRVMSLREAHAGGEKCIRSCSMETKREETIWEIEG